MLTLFSLAERRLVGPWMPWRLVARRPGGSRGSARPGIDLDLAMSREARPSRLACSRDSVERPAGSSRLAWEPRREPEVERLEDTWAEVQRCAKLFKFLPQICKG